MFEILYDERAVHELQALDSSVAGRIVRAIELKLARSPHTFGKPLRGSLKGAWSLRAGDWRVLYRIESRRVLIGRIGHRREVYE